MKRLFFIAVLFSSLSVSAAWADTVPPPVASTSTPAGLPVVSSNSIVMPPVEITTPTIIDAGETVSTPTPRSMLAPPPENPFITLTRSPVSVSSLPAHADAVDPEKTRTFDAQNAGEALSHEVSISFLNQGAAGYPLRARIRGATPNETLVLMDGRPMEGAALGATDLSEVPLEQIDHIEVVRGGESSLYGPNAIGGVINIITKRAAYTGFPLSHVSYENASYGRQTYKLDFGSRYGPLDYFFFGDQQWQSGFRSNSDNSQYNIGGNVGLAMGRGGKLLFDAGSYSNNAGIPGFRCDDTLDGLCLNSTTPLESNRFNDKDEKPSSTPNAREITDTTYMRSSYLLNLPADMFLAVRGYGQEREVNYDDSADVLPVQGASFDRREQTKGADLQLTMPYGFLIGGSYNRDREDFEDRITPANSFIASQENWGIFAQNTFRWNALTIILSGRYDQNSQFGKSSNPNVQTMLDATDWLRFSASAGRSFRAPTIEEANLNSTLNPETAWTYEGGFELHQSSISFRANYFRANVDNFIQSSTFSAANVGDARRQGAEIEISHVVNEHFRDSWNYTYLENVGMPAGMNHWVALAYSPRHSANHTLTFIPKEKWSIDSTLRFESSRFSGNDQTGTEMGSQLLWDLRLAYQWRQMECFLGVKDVFDKRYEEVPGFPLPGRTVFMGIRLRLWG